MAVVGPGAQQEIIRDVPSLLDGASEYEFVTILNPLTDDFAVRVATDVPINAPVEIRAKTGLVQDATDVTRSYGLDLKNPDFQGRKHFTSDTIIPAGKTVNLKGSEAQVAVRQLVNELLQREGHTRLSSDPTLRREAEERIVIRRGSIQELMDGAMQTPQQQVSQAIKNSNEVQDEPAFPGITQEVGATGSGQEAGTVQPDGIDESSPRRMGRPKKTDS